MLEPSGPYAHRASYTTYLSKAVKSETMLICIYLYIHIVTRSSPGVCDIHLCTIRLNKESHFSIYTYTYRYDELVPHHIHVVSEAREFAGLSQLPPSPGIITAKRLLNEMHHRLAIEGFVEVYVDQLDYNTVAVTRRCPHTDNSVVLVARTAFQCPPSPEETPYLKPLRIAGRSGSDKLK